MPPKLELKKFLANHSYSKAAEKYGVGTTTIARWAKKYDIRNDHKESLKKFVHPTIVKCKPSKEIVEDLYLNQKLSLYKIAKMYGVNPSSVYKWLKSYNIDRRAASQTTVEFTDTKIPTKEELLELYLNNSIQEITTKLDITRAILNR